MASEDAASEHETAVLASEIPAPTLEARLGVVSAVVRTCIGRVARPAADAPASEDSFGSDGSPAVPGAASLRGPAMPTTYHAVEVIYDSARVTLEQLEAVSGGWSVSPETFAADAAAEQKPHLRAARDFFRHMVAVYPDAAARNASTAATRLNGYLAGYGTVTRLDAELEALGLPQPLADTLRVRVHPTSIAPDVDRA